MLFINPNCNAKSTPNGVPYCVRCQKKVNPKTAKHVTIDHCYNVIDENQGPDLIGLDCWKLILRGE